MLCVVANFISDVAYIDTPRILRSHCMYQDEYLLQLLFYSFGNCTEKLECVPFCNMVSLCLEIFRHLGSALPLIFLFLHKAVIIYLIWISALSKIKMSISSFGIVMLYFVYCMGVYCGSMSACITLNCLHWSKFCLSVIWKIADASWGQAWTGRRIFMVFCAPIWC